MGQGKIPCYSHRLMHRKRVTCELHDSNFRLMTIKHAIPEILSGRLNYYITRWRLEVSQFLETRWWQDAVEEARIQRSGPLGPRLSSTRERERNTVMANRVRVNMLQFCSDSNSLAHANLADKVRGTYFSKRLCRSSLLLCRYDSVCIHICIMCLYS